MTGVQTCALPIFVVGLPHDFLLQGGAIGLRDGPSRNGIVQECGRQRPGINGLLNDIDGGAHTGLGGTRRRLTGPRKTRHPVLQAGGRDGRDSEHRHDHQQEHDRQQRQALLASG